VDRKIVLAAFITTLLILLLSMRKTAAVEPVTEPTTKPVKEIAIVEPVEVDTVTETPTEPELVSIGEFRLTAYCSCSKCCGKWAKDRPVDSAGNELVYGASGELLTAGYSIAVDPTVIPYGTVLLINGKEYEAMDCGGAIKDKRIDVYFNDHDEALEFGVQYAEVFIVEEVQK